MLAISASLICLSHAKSDPSAESFAIPAFQIASTYYNEGDIPEEFDDVFGNVRAPEEWKKAYYVAITGTTVSADGAKSELEVTPELVNAWFKTGIINPVLYFKAWVELEYPFWVACDDARGLDVDFEPNDFFVESLPWHLGEDASSNAYIALLQSDKSSNWNSVQVFYDRVVDAHIPVVSDLFVLVLFNRALPFYVLLLCFFISVVKKRAELLFVAMPVFCILLSLVLFAPMAMMRYAMEMYYALPILLIVCAQIIRSISPKLLSGSRESRVIDAVS